MEKKILGVSAFYIVLIGISLGVDFFSKVNIVRLEKSIYLPKAILYGLLAGLAIILLTYLLSRYTFIFRKLEIEFASILLPLSVQDIFFISIFSSLGEELFFRGILFQKVGLAGSSIIFGLIHFIPKKDFFPWTIFATLVGFVLGWIFLVTGNIFAPIVCHFIINFVNLLIIKSKFNNQKPSESS